MEIKDYRYSNELRTKAKALPMYEEFIKLVDDDKKVQSTTPSKICYWMRSNGIQAHKARTIGNRCMIQS